MTDMRGILKSTATALLSLVLGCALAQAQVPAEAKPAQPASSIILKLDDMTWDCPMWKKTDSAK